MKPVDVIQGELPLVLCFPHSGVHVPDEVHDRMNARGKALADTDWHVDRLYDGLLPGASVIRANFHRYVIDANRDPSDKSLYPGKTTTGLVPVIDFEGETIWKTDPSPDDIELHRARYHTPYHQAIESELKRVRDKHGLALLYDCHSIRSQVPMFFNGILPDFNIGTNDGQTCDNSFEQIAATTTAPYSSITNGRFKGGWTTRHYGRPDENIHAIQMELSQSLYMKQQNPPWQMDMEKSENVRIVLKQLLQALAEQAFQLAETKNQD
jgi:N-formylglutamate deformylase